MFGEVVDKVLVENNLLSKKDAWKLIDEKIKIAEDRKEHEASGSMEYKENKKSHFWLDVRVLIFLIFFSQPIFLCCRYILPCFSAQVWPFWWSL